MRTAHDDLLAPNVVPLDREGHAPTQALLPWYAAGRLDDLERAAVAAHLAGCARCRADAEQEQHWAALLAAADTPPVDDVEGATASAVEQGLADMHRRLLAEQAKANADPARTASPGRPRWRAESLKGLVAGGLARWRKFWPPAGLAPGWRWALGAQCAVILLLLSVRLAPTPVAAGYHGLGSETVPANAVVMFRPDTTEAQMRAALRTAHARLVGGPTATQAYLLWLPQADATALARLRAQPGVTLAESLDAEPVR
jgi:hypothetical protein